MTIHNPLAKRIAEEKKEENTMSKNKSSAPSAAARGIDQHGQRSQVEESAPQRFLVAFIGWWWVPVKWLYLTIPALIFKLFVNKKQKAINKYKTIAVCQRCGNSWEIYAP